MLISHGPGRDERDARAAQGSLIDQLHRRRATTQSECTGPLGRYNPTRASSPVHIFITLPSICRAGAITLLSLTTEIASISSR